MSPAAPVVDVYFDYGSPFAYFLSERLEAALAPFGAVAVWKPLLLSQLPAYAPYGDVKRRYVFVDVLRSAAYYGVSLRTPEPLPVQAGLAAAGACVARDDGIFPAYHRAVFRAAWVEARDIGDPDVLAACARAAGGDGARLVARARDTATAARVTATAAEASARGVFGVPTMLLGDEPFFGCDRLEQLVWRLGGGRRGSATETT